MTGAPPGIVNRYGVRRAGHGPAESAL